MHYKGNRPTIGLLMNQMDGMYQSPIWKGVAKAAQQSSINIIALNGKAIHSTNTEDIQHNIIYSFIRSERFDGFILSSGSLFNTDDSRATEILEMFHGIPTISISNPLPGIPTVMADNTYGMRELMEHMIHKHGFRKIGFIRGPQFNPQAEQRFQIYKESLEKAGIDFNPNWTWTGNFTYFDGRNGVHELLTKRGLKLDAIIAANDDMAFGAALALKELGLSIPGQIALTGYDDVEEVRYYKPALTTISQSLFDQGYKALELIEALLGNRPVPDKTVIRSRLVVRESCGCGLKYAESPESTSPVSIQAECTADSPLIEALIDRLFLNTTTSSSQNVLMREYIKKVASLLTIPQGSDFTPPMESLLDSFFLDKRFYDSEPGLWNEFLQRLEGPLTEITGRGCIKDRIRQTLLSITRRYFSEEHNKRVEISRVNWQIRDLTRNILPSDDLKVILERLSKTLGLIGIQGFFLSLYSGQAEVTDDGQWIVPEDSSLAMAYHKDAVDIINHTILYKTTSLLPDGYYPSNEPYQLALLPLCSGKDHFGTLLIDMDFPADFVFGTLQESISHILKSRNLYLNKVKAEQELTQALNTISKSEERFREMAFTLPTIIFELDLDLNIQYINDVGMRTLKIAQEELDKKLSIYDLVNPGDHPKLSNFCKDTLNQTKLNYFELKFARDDVKQTLLIRSMPLYNANQYKGIRWNAIDIKPWMISFATPSETFFNQYRLSQREREVFTLMVSGLNKKEIAEKLYIAESTVKDHISRIYAVTGVKNKGELFEAIQKFQGLRFGPESYLFSILSKIIKD